MTLTAERTKGKINSIAKRRNTDPRTLIRIYMMERFLERISQSPYKNNFIIKGGILITSMIGISMRSTMDIDTSLKNMTLDEEQLIEIINQIKDIDLNDNIRFKIKKISNIMDTMEYPGIRISLEAFLEQIVVPLKIDISTGDIITPQAIEYHYKLLTENRSISLLSYNLETILAKKTQTILARNVYNTRMRDFYDLYILLKIYYSQINQSTLKKAFLATCEHRSCVNLLDQANEIIDSLKQSTSLQKSWRLYQAKYSYAKNISFENVINSLAIIINMLGSFFFSTLNLSFLKLYS